MVDAVKWVPGRFGAMEQAEFTGGGEGDTDGKERSKRAGGPVGGNEIYLGDWGINRTVARSERGSMW